MIKNNIVIAAVARRRKSCRITKTGDVYGSEPESNNIIINYYGVRWTGKSLASNVQQYANTRACVRIIRIKNNIILLWYYYYYYYYSRESWPTAAAAPAESHAVSAVRSSRPVPVRSRILFAVDRFGTERGYNQTYLVVYYITIV